MMRTWTTSRIAWLAIPPALLFGCGNDRPAAPVSGHAVVVTGEVTAFDDRVPVDGGATITVATPDGDTVLLFFPSLYTVPPPPQETVDLYRVVRRIEVGDRVRAEGARGTAGVALWSLAILGGRP